MSQLGELFIELGVFADTKELEDFEKKLKKVSDKITDTTKKNEKLKSSFAKNIAGLAALGGAIITAAVAVNKLTNDLVRQNQSMLDLTRTTDIALNTFQKWNGIGKLFGVENAAQQLAGLEQRLFELRLTGQGARGFQLAGINPIGLDANGVLEQLRTRVAGMDDTAASYLLNQMGLDPKMLYLLRMGKEEFEELGRVVKRYQLTEDQRADIQKMNVEIQIAIMKLQYFKDRIILAIMPVWSKFINSIARIANLFGKITKNIINFAYEWRRLLIPLGFGLSKIEKIKVLFTSLSLSLSKLVTKLPIFGRAFTLLGAVINRAFLPITGILLLLDDLATYLEGGDSVIGDFFNWANRNDENIKHIDNTFANGDKKQGFIDLLINMWQALDNVIMEVARWIQIITGIPLKNWLTNFAEFVTRGRYSDLKNYNYNHYPKDPNNISTISNNTNSDNRQVNQNITIQTNQPVNDIYRELLGANFQFANP